MSFIISVKQREPVLNAELKPNANMDRETEIFSQTLPDTAFDLPSFVVALNKKPRRRKTKNDKA